MVSAFSYIRSLLMVIIFIPFLILVSASAILCNFLINNKKIDDQVAKIWGSFTCFIFGVKLVIHNPENKLSHGGLYLFNHSSFFDIFALQAAVPELRFGAKIELFKIPVFGMAMRRLGALPIARNRREEVIQIYKETVGRIHKGECFALAPEGGRSSSEALLPFKSGPFILAINSEAHVVPVVIQGAYDVMPKTDLIPNKKSWIKEIHITFLPQVTSTGYTIDQRGIFQQEVYMLMKNHLDSHPKKTNK